MTSSSQSYRALENWVTPGSRVLDLGCGEGQLLDYLVRTRKVSALGVEIDQQKMVSCVANGISVIEQDIDKGLGNFENDSFDTVLLTQTLQAVRQPDFVLQEMLRVGKECIITFPNFGHWQARLSLVLKGRMPVSRFMPYEWYDTPNIHFCTVKDFEALCETLKMRILDRHFLSGAQLDLSVSDSIRFAPNLRAVNAIYHVTRG